MPRVSVTLCLWTVGLLTVGFLALAGYAFVASAPATKPTFVIDSPIRDLGTVPVGVHEVTYAIRNCGSNPCRVVGSCGSCGLNCCLVPKRPGPIMLLPGESLDYVCELQVREPEPFATDVELYIGENVLQVVQLSVRGTGGPLRGP